MKIRLGFVSNSSSSSFCAYGIELSEDDLKYATGLFEETIDENKIDKTILENFKKATSENCDFNENPWELLELLETDSSLTLVQPDDQEYVYIGRTYSTLKDGETGKEFKETAINDVKRVLPNLPDDTKFTYIEEAWRD